MLRDEAETQAWGGGGGRAEPSLRWDAPQRCVAFKERNVWSVPGPAAVEQAKKRVVGCTSVCVTHRGLCLRRLRAYGEAVVPWPWPSQPPFQDFLAPAEGGGA